MSKALLYSSVEKGHKQSTEETCARMLQLTRCKHMCSEIFFTNCMLAELDAARFLIRVGLPTENKFYPFESKPIALSSNKVFKNMRECTLPDNIMGGSDEVDALEYESANGSFSFEASVGDKSYSMKFRLKKWNSVDASSAIAVRARKEAGLVQLKSSALNAVVYVSYLVEVVEYDDQESVEDSDSDYSCDSDVVEKHRSRVRATGDSEDEEDSDSEYSDEEADSLHEEDHRARGVTTCATHKKRKIAQPVVLEEDDEEEEVDAVVATTQKKRKTSTILLQEEDDDEVENDTAVASMQKKRTTSKVVVRQEDADVHEEAAAVATTHKKRKTAKMVVREEDEQEDQEVSTVTATQKKRKTAKVVGRQEDCEESEGTFQVATKQRKHKNAKVVVMQQQSDEDDDEGAAAVVATTLKKRKTNKMPKQQDHEDENDKGGAAVPTTTHKKRNAKVLKLDDHDGGTSATLTLKKRTPKVLMGDEDEGSCQGLDHCQGSGDEGEGNTTNHKTTGQDGLKKVGVQPMIVYTDENVNAISTTTTTTAAMDDFMLEDEDESDKDADAVVVEESADDAGIDDVFTQVSTSTLPSFSLSSTKPRPLSKNPYVDDEASVKKSRPLK